MAVQTVLFLSQREVFSAAWQQRYGDIFTIHVAPAGQSVVLTRPEHIREVFNSPATLFHAGEGNAILGPIMGEHSVLLLDEDAHLAARKRVMAAFRGDAMRGYGEIIDRPRRRQLAQLPSDEPVAMHQHMNDISLEVILRIVFGVTDESGSTQLRPLLQQLIQIGPTDLRRLALPGARPRRPLAAVPASQAGDRPGRLRRDRRPPHASPTSPSATTCCPSCWSPTRSRPTRNCATT